MALQIQNRRTIGISTEGTQQKIYKRETKLSTVQDYLAGKGSKWEICAFLHITRSAVEVN
ncbi:hypothetical protein [Desulfosporosinus sp. OT]|uniref:hypothetical protein n=1 Tax=Desulfosporosinus sp. OT TaxID=913865 RepID=UPI000223A59C|nr:hypothetical protein [Desulfosporosinus sp. OT]EGW40554.1 hypothetical protein DOT_1486 [Desulfosporosinus sp. OT]